MARTNKEFPLEEMFKGFSLSLIGGIIRVPFQDAVCGRKWLYAGNDNVYLDRFEEFMPDELRKKFDETEEARYEIEDAAAFYGENRDNGSFRFYIRGRVSYPDENGVVEGFALGNKRGDILVARLFNYEDRIGMGALQLLIPRIRGIAQDTPFKPFFPDELVIGYFTTGEINGYARIKDVKKVAERFMRL
ncbi:hypothetical protein J4405_01695 [Candidatus Woesearchaeota archaeon]|nr:hypothetical protein [Candidatus Woesearchaeota archaeon]